MPVSGPAFFSLRLFRGERFSVEVHQIVGARTAAGSERAPAAAGFRDQYRTGRNRPRGLYRRYIEGMRFIRALAVGKAHDKGQ